MRLRCGLGQRVYQEVYGQNAWHDFLREEHGMCVDESPQHNPHRLLHDVGPVEVLNLEPVDAVTVTTLMDNSLDLFMPDQGPAHRVGPQPRPARRCSVMTDREVPDALIAEHGFSMLVTISKAGHEHRVLFDAGASPDGVVENMRRLDVDPSSIEAIVCSHGHFDHTAGLDGLLRVLGPTGMPVLIHPHFWRRRRAVFPGREPFELPTTSATALREVGFDIIENQQPSFLLDRSVLITGEVPRVSGYEPGFPIQQAWIDEVWQPDPLVLDDQALIVNVRSKGLIVITGCGHAGVVNISRYARRLTGEQPLHALLGGFHLNGPLFEPLIPRVLDDLALLDPQVLVPAHCTGWRAQHAMAARFGEAFVPNSIGTRFTF
ncbi:7,8-dihydropterin-6-yl-methyl-4-(beta-D-ribofuranosyl)aminobenzene 5'-phosphate synthase [Streptacidiphilus sp. MAP12-16]|uniref:MBL fold metallo-hydrolase n=1 Tax=Streptacidiphilus sp. MAP12-16 TaxID=3156300 RepID=UPI003512BA6F